jgi:hypothetical protein
MSFQKNRYKVIKGAISNEMAEFLFNYLNLKCDAVKYMYSKGLSPEVGWLGTWKDDQVPNMYSHYSDFAMETLLKKLHPLMERETEMKLVMNYSYTRIYKKGSVLERHKDRVSCQISTTLNLGGDVWPIYLEPNKNVGQPGKQGATVTSDNKGISINLEQGDMLVYNGVDLEHWREKFTGDICTQVFLHYADAYGQYGSQSNDGRPLLGVPKTT